MILFMIFYRFLFFFIDLLKIQRESFYLFLKKGLSTEISLKKPIFWSNTKFQIIFYSQYYKLIPILVNPQLAIYQSKTFSCKLYVPVL
uniref:RNA polymerase b-subunit n=1 Tax=Codium arenicola TaxID=1191365 RepID=A0A2P0QI22_9CHLO|nr:RNA polymerase b-subunit [Codium arenicola]ARO74390.1 RNA polymerase b-subunit [Codium arenicola]